jgi:hypothetical protein
MQESAVTGMREFAPDHVWTEEDYAHKQKVEDQWEKANGGVINKSRKGSNQVAKDHLTKKKAKRRTDKAARKKNR